MPWWAARTSNPVDAAKHSGSIPPLERFFISDSQANLLKAKCCFFNFMDLDDYLYYVI
jgi:hypothetical protein